MQLGISTYSFPWAVGVPGFMPAQALQPLQLLQYAANNHIRFVQFGDNLPLHQLTNTNLQLLKQQAEALRIGIEAGTKGLTEENINRYIHIAAFLESPFLRVVIDDALFEPSPAEVITTIKSLLPILQAANVILAIENHDRFPAAVLKNIIESTSNQWVGICLDTANSLGAGEGVYEVVDTLAPYTVNLHIKDITVKRVPHKMGFTVAGCVAGQGVLNIPAIIEKLRPYNKCCTATLELWPVQQSNIDATVQLEQQWVQQSLHYLKTIIT